MREQSELDPGRHETEMERLSSGMVSTARRMTPPVSLFPSASRRRSAAWIRRAATPTTASRSRRPRKARCRNPVTSSSGFASCPCSRPMRPTPPATARSQRGGAAAQANCSVSRGPPSSTGRSCWTGPSRPPSSGRRQRQPDHHRVGAQRDGEGTGVSNKLSMKDDAGGYGLCFIFSGGLIGATNSGVGGGTDAATAGVSGACFAELPRRPCRRFQRLPSE